VATSPKQARRAAIVILGCRLLWTPDGVLRGAVARRVRAGARAAEANPDARVVVSGGRVWGGVVEADGMREALARCGVSRGRVVGERCSHSTRENAHFTALLLGRAKIQDVVLVTCDWHAARAAALFRRAGLCVRLAPATSPPTRCSLRLRRIARERLLFLALLLSIAVISCGKGAPALVDAEAASSGDPSELAVIARAEDQRRSVDIPPGAGASHDVRIRRRVARALARIADKSAEAGLLRALLDEDRETVGWGAYGLGFACKGREEVRVRALAARAASLDTQGDEVSVLDGRIDPRRAVARALGKCGGALAEQVLVGWVRAGGPLAIPAAYGLGDVARIPGALTDEAASALLDASDAAGDREDGLAYLYPFGRLEHVGDAFSTRLIERARAGLSRPSTIRSFAIRALSRAGRGAADELARVVEGQAFSPFERAEAARGLSLQGEAGRASAGHVLARIAPDRDPFAIEALGGDEYGVVLALLEAFGGDAAKDAVPALRAFATLTAPGVASPTLLRRISALRCLAAGVLSRGAYDSELLQRCDLSEGGFIGARARLASLLQRPLVADRRAAWSALVKSPSVRVREEALEAIGRHPELGDAGRAALTEALTSTLPGVVATAADVIESHPERLMVLSAREIRSALDPRAPPPSTNPATEIDRAAAAALEGALKREWSPDLVETRVGLLDVAAAVRLPSARAAAEKACLDSNATVRDHAVKDLRTLGELSPSCPSSASSGSPVDAGLEPGAMLVRPVKATFQTDAGEVSIVFDPDLAPVAAARFVDLARRGFYRGIVVHRVVPGFVVQLGDPGGDGYGGSGSLLRCETSPVPYGAMDVGVALSGRDTGSSQIFVTLGRYPHLDGEFARVGHAEGDWGAIAEGDVIRDVKVEE
jgi:cyclophilin family peptidyl-prolyl cis-trans isomerase/uncharacterized SAM-binding protein YcdF (DUF218 family)